MTKSSVLGRIKLLYHKKIRIFHASLASLSAVLFSLLGQNSKVLCTHEDIVAMATTIVIMFSFPVFNIQNVFNTCKRANMRSFVNILYHLETLQSLSMNFGDNPRML